MCPETTQEEMKAAAQSASEAFKTWKDTSVLTRQQIMLKYQQKIKDNTVCRMLLLHFFQGMNLFQMFIQF